MPFETPPGNNGNTTTVLPSIKTPPFSVDRPALWFAQLEAQFTNNCIVTERDKFYRTLPLIDTRYAAEVEDVIISPPTDTPYETLKSMHISRFSKSRQAKLLQMLDKESLGDRTPSQHLRHLRSLVPDIDQDVIKARWLSHLPAQTQACLVAQKSATVNDLGELADKLHEIFTQSCAAASTTDVTQQIEALTQQISSLTSTVAALHSRQSRTAKSYQ